MLSPSGPREPPLAHRPAILRSGCATEGIEVILAQGSQLWQHHTLLLACPEVAEIITVSDKLADDSPPDRTGRIDYFVRRAINNCRPPEGASQRQK